MRLIDAEDIKARAREEAVAMEEPWKSKFAILVEWLVDKTFTAYDVEAKVAELEKRANDNDRCADRLSGIDSKKKIASWRARAEAFRDAAEIVRGKE